MSDRVGPNPGPVRMQKSLAAGEKLPEAVACATQQKCEPRKK